MCLSRSCYVARQLKGLIPNSPNFDSHAWLMATIVGRTGHEMTADVC